MIFARSDKSNDSDRLVGLGSRLLIVRSELGLTQREFARTLQLSYRAYQSYENGHRGIPTENLVVLGERHDVDLNWLLLGKSRSVMSPEIYEELEEFVHSLDRHTQSTQQRLLPAQRSAIISKWVNNRGNNVPTSADDVLTWLELMGARK